MAAAAGAVAVARRRRRRRRHGRVVGRRREVQRERVHRSRLRPPAGCAPRRRSGHARARHEGHEAKCGDLGVELRRAARQLW